MQLFTYDTAGNLVPVASNGDAQLVIALSEATMRSLAIAVASAIKSGSSSSTVSPAMVASRLTGVAPMAVMFDATGTTSTLATDHFRQIKYTFSYGDSNAGTWATNGQSKNSDVGGPLGVHVFDTPGTYTVTLTADDGFATASTSITIVVQDPEVFYAGDKTYCVATDGSTGWGPTGAVYLTDIPDKGNWNRRRIMFKRGQDFSASTVDTMLMNNAADVMFCAGGPAGDKPKVPAFMVGMGRPPADMNLWPDRITYVGLDFPNEFRLGGTGSDHLAYQCTISDSVQNTIGLSMYYLFSDPYQYVPVESWPVPSGHFVVDCTFPGGPSAQYNIYSDGLIRSAVIGCSMNEAMYHNLRICSFFKVMVAHNELLGRSNGSSYHCLKMHASGLADYAEPLSKSRPTWASRYCVVSKNKVGSEECNNAWLMTICPENDQVQEGIADAMVEDNVFTHSVSVTDQVDLVYGGKRITALGNSVANGSYMGAEGHVAALPDSWHGPYYTSRQ